RLHRHRSRRGDRRRRWSGRRRPGRAPAPRVSGPAVSRRLRRAASGAVTTTLVTNIGELTTMDPGHRDAEDELGTIHDGALVLGVDDQVLWVGRASRRSGGPDADELVDLDAR